MTPSEIKDIQDDIITVYKTGTLAPSEIEEIEERASKLLIGGRVRIKGEDEVKTWHEVSSHQVYVSPDGLIFGPDMFRYCGTEFTVIDILPHPREGRIVLRQQANPYFISLGMVDIIEPGPEFADEPVASAELNSFLENFFKEG